MLILTPLLGATIVAATVAPCCPPECSDDTTTATVIANVTKDTECRDDDAAQLLTACLATVAEGGQNARAQQQIANVIASTALLDLSLASCPDDESNAKSTGMRTYVLGDDANGPRIFFDGDRIVRLDAPNASNNASECMCKCCNDGSTTTGLLLPPAVLDAPTAPGSAWSARESDVARGGNADDLGRVLVDVRAAAGDQQGHQHTLPFMIQVDGDLKDVDLQKLIELHGLRGMNDDNMQIDVELDLAKEFATAIDLSQLTNLNVDKKIQQALDGNKKKIRVLRQNDTTKKKQPDAVCPHCGSKMSASGTAKAEAYAFTVKPGVTGEWVPAGKDSKQWITTMTDDAKSDAHAFTFKMDPAAGDDWITASKHGTPWVSTFKNDAKDVNEWTTKAGDQCIIVIVDGEGNVTTKKWMSPKDGGSVGGIVVPRDGVDFKFDTRLNTDTKKKDVTKKKREVKILRAPDGDAPIHGNFTVASAPAYSSPNQFVSQPVSFNTVTTTTTTTGPDETVRVIVQDGVVKVMSEGGVTVQECELQKCDRLQVLDESGRKLYELDLRDDESWQTNMETTVVKRQRQPRLSNVFSTAQAPKVVMGVSMGQVDKSLASHLGVEPAEVILVTEVHEGLPASRCGVQKFDIITRIDGESSLSPERVREILKLKEPGQRVELQVLRAGQCCQTIEVELDPAQDATGAAAYSFETSQGGSFTVDGEFGSLVQVLEGASQLKGIDASNAATQYWMLNSLDDLEGLEWADLAGVSDENGVVQRFLIRTPTAGEWQLGENEFELLNTEVDLSSDEMKEIIDLAMSRVADETEAASRLLAEVEASYVENADGSVSELRRDDMETSINRIEARLERLEALLGELIEKK